MIDLVMSIWNPKKDKIFEAAVKKISSLNEYVTSDKSKVMQNKWFRIVEDDPKSPMLMGMSENEHLIYYPENSTAYKHHYETSIKEVEILSGIVYDKFTNKSFKTGDRLTLGPGDEIQPYTQELPAYVKVEVTQIDDIWERICK